MKLIAQSYNYGVAFASYVGNRGGEYTLEMSEDYSRIVVEIIGRVPTEGYSLKKDAEISRLRAEAIKNYLIGRGIPESNIKARGSYISELEKQLLNQKKSKSGILLSPHNEIKILRTK